MFLFQSRRTLEGQSGNDTVMSPCPEIEREDLATTPDPGKQVQFGLGLHTLILPACWADV